MADFNGRIGAIVRAFEKYGAGDTNVRMTIRETLRAERRDGWQEGYSDGLDDQYQGSKAEAAKTRFGELDADGHLTPDCEAHDMWTIAAWLPKGREGEVAEFLAGHGIEVYRMWQARPDGKTPTEDS
jgi:hypothetical protein